MTISSPTELIRALLDEEFNDLIGTQESKWLDFKEFPPGLNDPRKKWELAKDVAAFANAGIGFIVFGVGTEKHVNEAVEAASRVVPFRKDSVDIDGIRKVIQSLVYPPLVRLGLEFYPRRKDADEALLVIEISLQDIRSVPFILRKALDSEGTVKGSVAIPVRDGDQSRWWSAEEIHELISHGLKPLSPRLPEPNLPPSPTEPSPPKVQPPGTPDSEIVDRADHLVIRAEELQEWEDSPTFALMAIPRSKADLIPKLYGDAGLAKLLADPPSLRAAGFNLQTGGKLETIEGAVVARAQHKVQILDRSGVFVAVVPGDRSFLQWGINDGVLPETHRINTLTLVEFTYEFFRFAEELKTRSEVPEWTYRLVARRFMSAGAVLEDGVAKPGAGHHRGRRASEDEWVHDWPDLQTPEKNAHMALTYFYALFERGPDDFGVFTEDGDISADAILAAADKLR